MAYGISFQNASNGSDNYLQETTRQNWRQRAGGGSFETTRWLSKAGVNEEATYLHSQEEAFAERSSKHERDVVEREPIGYVLCLGTSDWSSSSPDLLVSSSVLLFFVITLF